MTEMPLGLQNIWWQHNRQILVSGGATCQHAGVGVSLSDPLLCMRSVMACWTYVVLLCLTVCTFFFLSYFDLISKGCLMHNNALLLPFNRCFTNCLAETDKTALLVWRNENYESKKQKALYVWGWMSFVGERRNTTWGI